MKLIQSHMGSLKLDNSYFCYVFAFRFGPFRKAQERNELFVRTASTQAMASLSLVPDERTI
jgi:hypothetical protein